MALVPSNLIIGPQGRKLSWFAMKIIGGTPAKLGRVNFQIVEEWGTRFAMLQAGDADIVDVTLENPSG